MLDLIVVTENEQKISPYIGLGYWLSGVFVFGNTDVTLDSLVGARAQIFFNIYLLIILIEGLGAYIILNN